MSLRLQKIAVTPSAHGDGKKPTVRGQRQLASGPAVTKAAMKGVESKRQIKKENKAAHQTTKIS
jgi:hypothetical protein